MVYTPHQHPLQSFILITLIVAAGIFAGYFVHFFFTIFALLFWIQYTGVLSYMQFTRNRKKDKKHYKYRSITAILLNPQVRFFAFEFMAIVGIGTIFLYNTLFFAIFVLLAWWLFSVNFFVYYKDFMKYE